MATSLLDWIMVLLKDSEAREAFQADPKAAMSAAGMTSICGSDVRDARPYLLDNQNVTQVRQFAPAEAKTPHEQVRDIVDSYRVDKNYVADKKGPDDNHDGPGKFEKSDQYDKGYDKGGEGGYSKGHGNGHGGYGQDGYGGGHGHGNGHGGYGPGYGNGYDFGYGFGPIKDSQDSYNKSVEDNDNVKETGPASGKASAAANQGGSTVGQDQLSVGGNQPTVGNGNASDSSITDNSTLNKDDNSRGNEVNGDGSAGGDLSTENGGDVFGQGVAGGDIDHVGGLVGLKDIVDVGNVNVLSGIANLDDVLNGSLNDPLADWDLHDILREGILS